MQIIFMIKSFSISMSFRAKREIYNNVENEVTDFSVFPPSK